MLRVGSLGDDDPMERSVGMELSGFTRDILGSGDPQNFSKATLVRVDERAGGLQVLLRSGCTAAEALVARVDNSDEVLEILKAHAIVQPKNAGESPDVLFSITSSSAGGAKGRTRTRIREVRVPLPVVLLCPGGVPMVSNGKKKVKPKIVRFDHRNGDRLDCRMANLELRQTRFRHGGVWRDKARGAWIAERPDLTRCRFSDKKCGGEREAKEAAEAWQKKQ